MTDLSRRQVVDVEQRLEDLYNQWLVSQQILTAVCSWCPDHSRFKLKAGLENALMRRVLEHIEPDPIDLFAGLNPEGLAFGFSCVGLELDAVVVKQIYMVIQHQLATNRHVTLPEISKCSEYLALGDFVLMRNAPVNRLLDFAQRSMSERDTLMSVLCSALQYGALYAETRHIGPPQCVYDDFHSWGIRNEGFASPFNARLLGKEASGFFSAFPQTDRVFGSRGSFFHTDWKQYEGAWCVDPPFLEETLSRVDRIVGRWRSEGGPAVLFIGPSSYQMQTPFDEEVRLYKGTHFYEGLDGELHPLPMDVSIWRFGDIEGFDVDRIIAGYLPTQTTK